MTSNPLHFSWASARIETLESRCLLSASPTVHLHALPLQTPAVRAKATVPALAGVTLSGTFKLLGIQGPLTIVFTSETATGVVHATVTGPAVFSCTGTVKSTGKIALHGKAGKVSLALSGALNATRSTLTGKVIAKGKKTVSGTYTVSRQG